MGRRRIFALVTALGALVCALLAIEVGLRVLGYTPTYVNPLRSFHTNDPDLGYRGKPGFTGRFTRPSFDVIVAHDDLGFRRQERQRPEAASAVRIFCLGDSFTWGWGVGQGEAFTEHLSDRIADAHVVNRGVNASGTVYQWRLYERDLAPRTRPGDVVLVLFCDNDFGDNLFDEGQEPSCVVEGGVARVVSPTAHLEEGFKDRLKDLSYAFNLVDFAANVAKKRARAGRERTKGVEVAKADDEPRRIATRFALAGLALDVRARGASLLVARIPEPPELLAASDPAALATAQGFKKALEEICAAEGIELLDLAPALRGAPASDADGARSFFPDDEHWTREGHARAGAAIAARIAEIRARPR